MISKATKKQLGEFIRALFTIAITAVVFFILGGIKIAGGEATARWINRAFNL